jgi:ABC-2 type transport system ATP-binding protein
MLEISQVDKTYPNDVRALDGIDLQISPGMFGLLGPNGAGKSTLMRTIATLQNPDRGSLIFDDIDVRRQPLLLRQRLGYLPQEFGVFARVRTRDLLAYIAKLKGLTDPSLRRQQLDHVLDLVNLTAAQDQYVSEFSGGMKRRFGIAQLLLNNPDLIIVDEPTAGLDPAERNHFLDVLRSLAGERVVIFSTHIVEDVADLCDRVGILAQGRLLWESTVSASTKDLAGQIWQREFGQSEMEQANRLVVLSKRILPGQRFVLRIHSSAPPPGPWQPVTATLADRYFLSLHG